MSSDRWAHSLTLQFGRVLGEAEWREVVELARQLPYVQGLEAKSEPAPDSAMVQDVSGSVFQSED